ncbi:MAG: protein kinase [Anaerolineales bacterium]|nr:protein kinase [Anaerolineales bacterium]
MSIYLFAPGDIIERKFRILATLGRGRLSQVYKAEDLVKRGICVLKVLQPADDAVDSLEKLREEANIYDKLGRHKHIAQLLDTNKFAELDDLLYLKLEYVEGKTIEAYLKDCHGPPPPISITETRQIILELLEALDFMHNRPEPILHRDIKPSNLILSPTRGLVVIDFNVSKELVTGEKAQSFVGTFPYIPPENISRGNDWDITGDLYAVGVLLYKMLTNKELPFPTRMGSSLGLSLIDFEEILPSLPVNVIDILNQAIAFKPQDRFQSAREMKEAIENKWPIDLIMKTSTEVKDMNMDNVINPGEKIVNSLTEVEDMLHKWETEEPSPGWLADQAALLGAVGYYLQAGQSGDDGMRHEEVKNRFIRWIRPILVDSLANNENEITKLKKIRLSAENFDATQTRARAAQTLLEIAGGLRWAMSDAGHALLDRGNELFIPLRYSLEQWRLFFQAVNQIETSLTEAQKREIEAGGGGAAAALAGDADNAVKALEQQLDTSDDTRLRSEFLMLKQRVGSAYSELRGRHEIPTTAITVEPLANMIRQWCELPSDTRVTYYEGFLTDDIKEVKISEALNTARERYRTAIINRIDEQYAKNARKYIQTQEAEAVRYPDKARMELARWRELPGITEPNILPPDMLVSIEKRLKTLTEEVETEYQKWDDADKHIGYAQGIVSDDPLEAYQEYKNALKDYAYHAALPNLLLKIRAQAAQALESGIREIEQAVQHESWATVRQKIQTVKDLAALESPTADQQEKLNRLQSLIRDYITPLEKTGRQPQEELVLLKRLQTDYVAYWAQWIKYPARLKQLQVRQAVDGLLEDVGRLTHKEASVIELRQLRDDLIARPGLNKSSTQTKAETEKKLRQALTKVMAWLGYAQARDELRKEDELKTFAVDEVDEIYIPVLDLVVMQNGLTAAEKDSAANDAAIAAGFSFRLKRLQTKDKEVAGILEQVRREQIAITEPDVARLREWRDKLKSARKIPSSHIREILALYHDVQTLLHEAAADRLKALLRDNLTNFFETTDKYGRFNSNANNILEKEIKSLLDECGRDQNDPLVQTAVVAQAFIRAHRIKARVRQTNNLPAVKEAWDRARQFEPDELVASSSAELEDLRQYAEYQYKQAWKQTVFADAAHKSNKIVAETQLWDLCQDILLRHAWDVWFQHGRHCLAMAREWLQNIVDDQHQQADQYLNKAYRSLGQAQTLVLSQQESVPGSEQTAVDNAVSECAGWMRVVALDNQICKTLLLNSKDTDKPIASADCQRAVTDYNNATTKGQQLESAQQQTMTRIWRRRREAALQRLETLYPKIAGATALFDQLDNLVARAILQPDNLNIAALIRDHFERTLSSLEQNVDPARGGITFDESGVNFRSYYQQQHSGQTPPDEQIADLQKETAESQQRQANTLRLALPLTQLEADLYMNRLNQIDDQLERWRTQVAVELINPLTEAKNKADSGLCDPQHFKTARYILRMSGGNDAGDIARIGTMFTNHITVVWQKTYLGTQEQRQQRQQKHFNAIDKILRDEAEFVSLVQQARKSKTPLSSEQTAKLEQQTNNFRQAVAHLDRMQKEEPNDRCCLQNQLEYDASYEPVTEGDDGYYRGLDNVRTAVAGKIKQHDQAAVWAAERRADYENPRRTASFGQAMQMVNNLGIHSKLGLIAARKFLAVVKGDDSQDRYRGNWTAEIQRHAESADVVLPLEATWLPSGIYENAFTLHGLLAACQESKLKAHLNVKTLFAITEANNQKRHQLCDDIEQDIQLADAEMASLRFRAEMFQEKWEQFRQAATDLYAVGWPRRRRLTDQPEWDALINAKNDFCEICSNYEEFTQTLQDLHNDLAVRKLDCHYD